MISFRVSSATIQRNGAVRMEGIIDGQETEIKNAGFQYKGSPTVNTSFAVFKNKYFTDTFYPAFEPAKTYDFVAWIEHMNTRYNSSNSILLDSIVPIKGCLKQFNTVTTGEDTVIYSYASRSESWDAATGIYQMRRACYFGPSVELRFGSLLEDGIYTTVDKIPQAGAKDVYIYFSYAADPAIHILDAGTKIEVRMKTIGYYEVFICDAPWKVDQKIHLFSTRLGFGIIECFFCNSCLFSIQNTCLTF